MPTRPVIRLQVDAGLKKPRHQAGDVPCVIDPRMLAALELPASVRKHGGDSATRLEMRMVRFPHVAHAGPHAIQWDLLPPHLRLEELADVPRPIRRDAETEFVGLHCAAPDKAMLVTERPERQQYILEVLCPVDLLLRYPSELLAKSRQACALCRSDVPVKLKVDFQRPGVEKQGWELDDLVVIVAPVACALEVDDTKVVVALARGSNSWSAWYQTHLRDLACQCVTAVIFRSVLNLAARRVLLANDTWLVLASIIRFVGGAG
mmetsp:Transcript_9150/g.23930  ORF Transcript_9150/g.23930 Transcript_9150/m.23930 type:complete len:263 (+) Transcript_9150:188-976(+)